MLQIVQGQVGPHKRVSFQCCFLHSHFARVLVVRMPEGVGAVVGFVVEGGSHGHLAGRHVEVGTQVLFG